MGLFDPAHKKMLAKAPAGFQAAAMLWGTLIETVIVTRSPLNPDIFRALVVGMVALRAASEEPHVWSRDAVNFITGITNNAYRAMSEADREMANATFAAIVIGDADQGSN